MKIIETKAAPNPRRVRIFLAEKGITVPYEEVGFMKGELKTTEFAKVNPNYRVPVLLLDDGTAISETVAICRYFEETQPKPALFGEGAKGRAIVEMWQRRVELGLWSYVTQAFRHIHPAIAQLELPQVKDWGEACKSKALDELRLLDAQLGSARFIAGDAYGIADITALCAMDFMRPARITRPPELKNVERWYNEVSARPSAKA